MSDNIDFCVVFSLASTVFCLFYCHLFSFSRWVVTFLTLHVCVFFMSVLNNFKLCSGYFEHYVLRFWSHLAPLEDVDIFTFSSVQLISRVRLLWPPWITARQASMSITNSWSLCKLMSIESVMPSSHLILCCPLLLLPRIPPSIRVFSNESALHMRWPKY